MPGFSPRERLTRSRDFQSFREIRPAANTRDFRLKVRPNGLDCHRLGVVTSRKVGGAVLRNRIRRLVREVFRINKALLGARRGFSDLLVIVKPTVKGETRQISFQETQRQLSAIWR